MYGDGTFYVAAKYFYQLYLLHGWYNYYMIPCAWILMTKRRSIDYIEDHWQKILVMSNDLIVRF